MERVFPFFYKQQINKQRVGSVGYLGRLVLLVREKPKEAIFGNKEIFEERRL